MTARNSLQKLFSAKAIAVIGASADTSKLGSWPFLCLRRLGYQGGVYGVNPKYDKLFDWPCVPSIADLPDEVEAAIIMLKAGPAVDAAEACGRHGILAVVIGASGFGETGAAGRLLEERLLHIANQYGLALCGPNGDGIASFQTGQALCFQPILLRDMPFTAGGVTLISHSGAMISMILSRLLPRGVGMNAVVACGNQIVLSMEDYLDHFAQDGATEVIVLFVEAIRRPMAMREALARCRTAGKRVVVLKIGESTGGLKAAASHTGAIAGSYPNSIAFFEKEGATCVNDLEQLALVVEALTKLPSPMPALDIAIVSYSGGLAALAADCCERSGIKVREIGSRAAQTLAELSQMSQPCNPYDLAGRYSKEFVADVLSAFAQDGFKVLLFGLGVLPDPPRGGVLQAIAEAAQTIFPHTFIFCPAPESIDLAFVAENGLVLIEEVEPALRALSALSSTRIVTQLHGRTNSASLTTPPATLDERSLKSWLSVLGIQSPRSVVVDGRPPSINQFNRPLVVKGLTQLVAHKTEEGLVELGLYDDGQLQDAVARVRDRLRRVDPEAGSVLVEEMVTDGIEVFLGCVRDPILGPVVAVGAGGILVEFLKDSVVLIPPFTRMEAEIELGRTRVWHLLAGFRGRTYDREALLDAVEVLGQLAQGVAELQSLEINPLFVLPRGVLAGDAKLKLIR
jgi:acetate---CoA ligase (ADP-forming)